MVQLLENVDDIGIQFPDASLSEVLVGDFEEIISIQFADFGGGFAEHLISQFAPPIFVVVFAWAIDCVARRHLRPGGVEGGVQFFASNLKPTSSPPSA